MGRQGEPFLRDSELQLCAGLAPQTLTQAEVREFETKVKQKMAGGSNNLIAEADIASVTLTKDNAGNMLATAILAASVCEQQVMTVVAP